MIGIERLLWVLIVGWTVVALVSASLCTPRGHMGGHHHRMAPETVIPVSEPVQERKSIGYPGSFEGLDASYSKIESRALIERPAPEIQLPRGSESMSKFVIAALASMSVVFVDWMGGG